MIMSSQGSAVFGPRLHYNNADGYGIYYYHQKQEQNGNRAFSLTLSQYRSDRHLFQTLIYGVPFVLNSIVLLLVVFLNIQNHILYTDYLTGVNNRKRLDAYLNEKVSLSAREKGFSAILIDIDNFKHINDTYGHNMGDEALESTANLLKTCLRTGDFARYGGDEFCVVLDVSDRTL